MYVGITRAKDLLHLTWAQKRRVWGDVKFFPPSRFIEEIPANLRQEDETSVKGAYNNGWGGSKVSKDNDNNGFSRQRGDFNKNSYKGGNENRQKSVAAANSSSSFTSSAGGSLLSSIARIKKSKNSGNEPSKKPEAQQVQRTEAKNFVVKKHKNENFEKPKMENLHAQAQKSAKVDINIQDIIARCKEQAKTPPKSPATQGFRMIPEGTRVFHQQFGVGHIRQTLVDKGETSYVVEFTKAGTKTLDANSGSLKMF